MKVNDKLRELLGADPRSSNSSVQAKRASVAGSSRNQESSEGRVAIGLARELQQQLNVTELQEARRARVAELKALVQSGQYREAPDLSEKLRGRLNDEVEMLRSGIARDEE